MYNSSKKLYKYFSGTGNLENTIIDELFGRFNWTQNMIDDFNGTLSLFLGIYKGIYLMNISYNEINRCYQTNKLDEFIHVKYSICLDGYCKSLYYEEFCQKKIKIGRTSLKATRDEDPEYSESSDEENEKGIYIYNIINPPYHMMREEEFEIGLPFDKILDQKINGYKNQDRKKNFPIEDNYINKDDIKKLFKKQENKCYICGDIVLLEDYNPNCLYQFTLNRINNNMPHNKNNVLISCYYCNCCEDLGYTDKICPHKCHKIKRDIQRKKNNISKEEIEKLLNK